MINYWQGCAGRDILLAGMGGKKVGEDIFDWEGGSGWVILFISRDGWEESG